MKREMAGWIWVPVGFGNRTSAQRIVADWPREFRGAAVKTRASKTQPCTTNANLNLFERRVFLRQVWHIR